MRCNGKLIKNTGITPGNYKYFPSKSGADDFFLSKAFHSFSDYTVVRGETPSKHGYNVQCVHVDLPYNDTILCDYVAYQNSGDNRWMFGIVTTREYVNEKSTRLYFTIDYVASYWDTIKLGKSFIERTHVDDDWVGSPTSQMSANKYFLPEPVGADAFNRSELVAADPFSVYNSFMTLSSSEYMLQTSVSQDGEISNPTINFQAGGATSGYLYNGDKETIEEIMSKYVTFMNRPLSEYKSLLNFVTSVYVCPEIIAGDRDAAPKLFPMMNFPIIGAVNYDKLPEFKNAKTLSFIKYGVRSGNNITTFDLRETGNIIQFDVIFIGSPNGYAQIKIKNKDSYYMGVDIQTPNWPAVAVTGTEQAKEYSFNMSWLEDTALVQYANLNKGK